MISHIDRWNGFTVYTFKFESPIDLCNYVKRARINERVFSRKIVKSQGSEGSDTTLLGGGWYQTKDLSEAIKLCKNGWYEGFDFFKKMKRSLEATGDRVYVFPADEANTVNLYVNLSYCWETSKGAVLNRGVIIQNLINQLEKNGYNVCLNAFTLISADNELSNIIIKLKDKKERLDIQKVYFAFCNPSFLRRLVFRVMESSHFQNPKWQESYGVVCDSEFIKKAYNTGRLDIVIPQPSEIGITGDSINEDWRTFLKYANLQKYFND